MTRRWLAMLACAATAIAAAAVAQDIEGGRDPLRSADAITPNSRFGGMQWRFTRIRYSTWRSDAFASPYDEPWFIDCCAAEQNLTRRLRTVTSLDVAEPVILRIDDPRIVLSPWIYIVEGGNLRLKENEVPILREFLLRGGTLTFDDFHGEREWANVERELKRVFPDRPIVELTPEHPIYGSFYKLDHFPQTPGLGAFLMGRTWEKGGFVAHLRAIVDDHQRPMVLINWNTDMGDGMEWSNATDYPGYIKYTAQAYRMMINEIVYSLTH